MQTNPLIETWNISASMNDYLLNNTAENNLVDAANTKGRNVGEQFAHIHNVRLMWLKVADVNLFQEQEKLEKEATASKEALLKGLKSSKQAIATLL